MKLKLAWGKERINLVLGGKAEPGNNKGWVGENFIILFLFFLPYFTEWA